MVRESTKRVGKLYKGVVRDGARIVWECSHFHTNRDTDSYGFLLYQDPSGMSALTCAAIELHRQDGPGIAEYAYDADCPACLRGREHTIAEHEAKLLAARGEVQ